MSVTPAGFDRLGAESIARRGPGGAARRDRARRRRARHARALRGSRRRADPAAVHRRRSVRRPGRGHRARRLRTPSSVPPLGYRSPRCSSATASVPPRSASCTRFLNPLWDLGVVVGHQVRDIEDFQRLETDNPGVSPGAARRAAGGGRALRVRALRRGLSPGRTRTPSSCARCSRLIEERHAKFNDTLYQLEPDVKDAPGALRDLTATRTIAMLTDPLLLRRGPADAARFDDAEDFLLRVRSTLHLECGRNQNVLSHELQERTAEMLGYPGAEPRQRVEKLMSDYFRHARIVSRSLEWARRTAPCRSAPTSGSRATASGSSIRCRRRAIRRHGSATFQAALDAGTEVSEEALSCIQQHVDRYRADDFFAGRAGSRGAAAVPQAAAGTLRAALADARLRSARACLPRVPGDLVARGPRLLPQVHGRRAHAADDPEPRAAHHAPTRRIGCGSGRSSAISRSQSCSCSRCSFTTWASGATTTTRSRACGWRSRCSSGCR